MIVSYIFIALIVFKLTTFCSASTSCRRDSDEMDYVGHCISKVPLPAQIKPVFEMDRNILRRNIDGGLIVLLLTCFCLSDKFKKVNGGHLLAATLVKYTILRIYRKIYYWLKRRTETNQSVLSLPQAPNDKLTLSVIMFILVMIAKRNYSKVLPNLLPLLIIHFDHIKPNLNNPAILPALIPLVTISESYF